ncbi:MAG: hypothetical protein ABIE43_04220 [Patescibacteria group bacterium]
MVETEGLGPLNWMGEDMCKRAQQEPIVSKNSVLLYHKIFGPLPDEKGGGEPRIPKRHGR